MLQFWPDVQETRTPARFTVVAERGATIDLASPDVRAFIDLLKQNHIVIDPTALQACEGGRLAADRFGFTKGIV